MNFRRYEDPARAVQVWSAYKEDIARFGAREEAKAIARRCYNACELEINLEIYLTQAKAKLFGTLSYRHREQESPSFSNAVRFVEDNRVH